VELEVNCDCGWSCRGPEPEVIRATIEHGRQAHDLELTPEQARAAARPATQPRDEPAR
jgi:predicted small metal-binding protein